MSTAPSGLPANLVVGPFSVEPSEGWTECECPPQLCRHSGGMRPYLSWIVWDAEADEHAYITRGDAFANEYDRKRDAVAAVRRYLG